MNFRGLLIAVMTLQATYGWAHDTTHIHPMITKRVSDLIAREDGTNARYSELYKKVDGQPLRGHYWGKDRDLDNLSELTNLDYLFEDQLGYYGDNSADNEIGFTHYDNVMDGVVQEDAPSLKVLNHFYHAKSGSELALNGYSLNAIPSVDVAMMHFKKSISWYNGYTEAAKKRAYFIFGQSLHHVEDMSSPAHVHNDAHLTISDHEKDDYEGWFLPVQKRIDHIDGPSAGNKVDEFFGDIANYTIRPVNDPWRDIWGANDDASMVGYTYNSTSFSGSLAFPYSVRVLGVVVEDAESPTFSPSGELAEMFPECSVTNTNHCLEWVEDGLIVPAHWQIRGVGEFHHQYFVGSANDWWAVEFETNPDIATSQTANFIGDFYIEQLSINTSNETPEGEALIPERVRQPLHNGELVDNVDNKSLMEIYARNLLQPGVEFSAGFSQYWFDVANTPPFLQRVVVSQMHSNGQNSTVYDAGWSDVTATFQDTHNIVNSPDCNLFTCPQVPVSIEQTIARQFDLTFGSNFSLDDFRHIHARDAATLVLYFNEPIKAITELRFGHFIGDSCVQVGSCLTIDVPSLTSINALQGTQDPWIKTEDNDATWIITLKPEQLMLLNGKVQLSVSAIDKNNHRDGQGGTSGGQLDSSPVTPAKRNMFVSSNNRENHFPWHRESENNGIPAGDDTQSDDERQANIDYSYDPGADKNHILLFDTKFPSATITVTDASL